MKQQEGNQQALICPSCGQPAAGLAPFKISDKVKMLFIAILLGYVILSLILLGMSATPEMRRGCGSFDGRWQIPNAAPDPNRCKDTEFTLWMKQINKVPAFQVFVGGGMVTGILMLYWDWFQGNSKNWRRNRGKSLPKLGERHKYKCRHCGRQWS